jgi:hypothetical protein
MNNKNKNTGDISRGIKEFMRGYQPRDYFVKNEAEWTLFQTH